MGRLWQTLRNVYKNLIDSSEYKNYATRVLQSQNSVTIKGLKTLKDQVKSTIAEVLNLRTEVMKTMVSIQDFQDCNFRPTVSILPPKGNFFL